MSTMIKIIQQFPLTQENTPNGFTIKMPWRSEILSVGLDSNNSPCIWALTNPNAELEDRHFELYSVGQEIYPTVNADRIYIGRCSGNHYVGHLFERMEYFLLK